jgi:pimeloyl-ACP methyl ester carboxylesterase
LCAIDLRAHGETKTKDESDVGISILINDIVNILKYLNDQKKRFFTIIGHSVGGAVAIHTVDYILNSKINLTIASMIVIDIVEGTALESLEYTKKVLEKRPKEFKSLERAIQWSLESQFLSNVESSRV